MIYKSLPDSKEKREYLKALSRYKITIEKARDELAWFRNRMLLRSDEIRQSKEKESRSEKNAARQHIVLLRNSGWTYKKIGAKIGKSVERTRQIFEKERRRERKISEAGEPTVITTSTPVPSLEMHLGTRAYNCLRNAEVRTVGELVGKTPEDLLRVKNLGFKALREIQSFLSDHGLRLREDKP